jgi:signal transduction histidine kinase
MQAQAELIRSEKLAAIGQLAAGVAHEVNNPLAGILVYVKLLLKKYEAGRLQSEETEKQLLKIETELVRSSRIIKDLLDFSRQSKPALRPVDVNEALESTLSIVGHQISLGNIQLDKNLATGLPRIMADFDQIQQAMMNLILNAAQAMPDGGALTITTSCEKAVELHGSVQDAVKVEITDTGRGIPKKNLDKVFAPFFSTKVKGKGVGLGLAAVQGIIERHKSRIKVTSEVNAGTTFTIWLGAADEETGENTDRRR